MLPTIILYQPKTLNPFFVKNAMKPLIAINATINATIFPIIKTGRLSALNPNYLWYFNILYPVAANIVGTAKKNENSAAAFLVSF